MDNINSNMRMVLFDKRLPPIIEPITKSMQFVVTKYYIRNVILTYFFLFQGCHYTSNSSISIYSTTRKIYNTIVQHHKEWFYTANKWSRFYYSWKRYNHKTISINPGSSDTIQKNKYHTTTNNHKNNYHVTTTNQKTCISGLCWCWIQGTRSFIIDCRIQQYNIPVKVVYFKIKCCLFFWHMYASFLYDVFLFDGRRRQFLRKCKFILSHFK